MGLFDFFKKESTPATDIKPLEEYLKQRPLWYAVKCMLGPTLPYPSIVYNSYTKELRHFHDFDKDFLKKDGEPIPKCYYNKEIKIITLLELLLEENIAGDKAALYLALFYEHHLGPGTYDESTADLYYARAESLCEEGSTIHRCLKAIEYIKKECVSAWSNNSLTNNPKECLALAILLECRLISQNIHTQNKTLANILIGEDRSAIWLLYQIGVQLVYHYAQENHPYSMTMLASFMQRGELDEYFPYTNSEIIKDTGDLLLKKVIKLSSKDDYARACVKKFGIKTIY